MTTPRATSTSRLARLALFFFLGLANFGVGYGKVFADVRPLGAALASGAAAPRRAGNPAGNSKCTRRARGLDRDISDAVGALDALSSARAGRSLSGASPSRPAAADHDELVRSRLGRLIREHGRPPDLNPAGALRALLKSKDIYCVDSDTTRRPL